MCLIKSFRPVSRIPSFSIFSLLLMVLLVGAVSAGTHADALATAQKYQTALSTVSFPREWTVTPAFIQAIGYPTTRCTITKVYQNGTPIYDCTKMVQIYSGATYYIKIKSAIYNAENGTLSINFYATRNGSTLELRNPIHFYMPFNVPETTNTQRLNSFLILFISYLENKKLGKIENDDTLVVYPDIDGAAAGWGGTYSTIRADTGDFTYLDNYVNAPYLISGTITNEYDELRRAILSFNTAALPDTCTINSAILSLQGAGKSNGLGSPGIGITGGTLIDHTALANGDYDGFASTELASQISYASWSTSGANNFTLNAAGLSYISKTDHTILFARDSWDISNSFGGVWVSSASTTFVWLSVRLGGANRPLLEITYTTVSPPVAGYTHTCSDHCGSETCSFTDTSTNSPTSWSWKKRIDDGSWVEFSTSQNPTNIEFSTAGEYDISLTATNAGGSDEEIKNNIFNVWVNPVAAYSCDDLDVCSNQDVTCTDSTTGTPNAWSWKRKTEGGYVEFDTDQNAVATFAVGLWDIKLDVSTAHSCIDDEEKLDYLSSDTVVVSDFTYGDVTICEGESVIFTDASSGTEESYTWDCTNDDVDDYTTQNAECTYPDAGTYSVEHCVDNSGCSADCEVKIDLVVVSECPIPVAAFSCIPLSGYDPLSVDCTDSSTGSPTSWSWKRKTTGGYVEFSTDQNPTDISFTLGTWDVKLTATNEYGYDDEEKLDYIVVSPEITPIPVVASFTYNVSCGDEPLSVQFNDTSSGGPDEWYWDFNEGNTSILQNPVNMFYNGTYSVYFHATNTTIPDDDWENKTDMITVPCEEEITWFHLPPFYSVENITGPFNNITIGIFPIALGELFKAGNILIPYLAFLFGWLLFLSIFLGGRRI